MDVFDLIYLIPLAPLAGFVITWLGRNRLAKRISFFVGLLVTVISFVLGFWVFRQTIIPGFEEYNAHYFQFIHTDRIQMEFGLTVDSLISVLVMVITGAGLLVQIYSWLLMRKKPAGSFAKFSACINLLVFSMLLLVMGSNFLMRFIGIEGVVISSYLLISFYAGGVVNKLFFMPVKKIAVFFENIIDRKVVDGFVNNTGKVVVYASRQIRHLQSGQLAYYFLLMVLGVIIFFAIQMFF